MQWFRYLALAGVTVMLIGSIVASGAFHSLRESVLEPYSLQRYAESDDFYVAFQAAVEKEMLASRGAELLRQVDPDDVVLRKSLKVLWEQQDVQRWFEGQFALAQENVWDIATGKATKLAALDFSALRDRALDLIFGEFSSDQRFVIDRLFPDLRDQLRDQLPMQVDLAGTIAFTEQDARTVSDAYARVKLIDNGLVWLSILIAGAGIALWGRIGIALQWGGIALLGSGVLLLLASIVPASELVEAMLPSWLSEEARPAVRDALRAMWSDWTDGWAGIGSVLLFSGAGLSMLEAARTIYRNRKGLSMRLDRRIPRPARWLLGATCAVGVVAVIVRLTLATTVIWL